MSEDILQRLKGSAKINGAYTKDVTDAIKEIERLRELVWRLEDRLDECISTATHQD